MIADFGRPEGEVYTPAGQCLAPDIFCGSDTVHDPGADGCVSATEVSCGESTVEQSECCMVEDAKSCGAGTVLADGVCVLTSSVCGPGSQLNDDACTPSAAAYSTGTEFDVLLSECVDLNSVECGNDTVLGSNNTCVPLVTFADELASQADLDASDPGTTITHGDVGDQTIFTGTMSNQRNLFQVFKIDVDASKWVQIPLFSRGVPSFGFRLRQSF